VDRPGEFADGNTPLETADYLYAQQLDVGDIRRSVDMEVHGVGALAGRRRSDTAPTDAPSPRPHTASRTKKAPATGRTAAPGAMREG
jgi:hypothetical protein